MWGGDFVVPFVFVNRDFLSLSRQPFACASARLGHQPLASDSLIALQLRWGGRSCEGFESVNTAFRGPHPNPDRRTQTLELSKLSEISVERRQEGGELLMILGIDPRKGDMGAADQLHALQGPDARSPIAQLDEAQRRSLTPRHHRHHFGDAEHLHKFGADFRRIDDDQATAGLAQRARRADQQPHEGTVHAGAVAEVDADDPQRVVGFTGQEGIEYRGILHVGQAANVQRSRRFEGVCTVAQIDGECARNPEGSSGSLFFKQYGIVTVATEYAEGSAEVVTSQIANSSPVEQNPEIHLYDNQKK